jgi:hypothetical protein
MQSAGKSRSMICWTVWVFNKQVFLGNAKEYLLDRFVMARFSMIQLPRIAGFILIRGISGNRQTGWPHSVCSCCIESIRGN